MLPYYRQPGSYGLKLPYCRHPCKSFVKLRHGCPGHAQESVQVNSPRMFHTQKYASRQSVPALGRTRHPFAVSGLEGPSQKIEFVFSASPETIRREPREGDLLRSVGNRQDLAVCAFCSSCLFRQHLCCCSPAFFSRCKVSLLPIHGKQIRYHLPGSRSLRGCSLNQRRL